MFLSTIFIQKIVLAFLIGALIGLEREFTKKQETVGIRTFSLISLFGCLLTFMSERLVGNYLPVVIGLVFVCSFALMLFLFWAKKSRSLGFTTNFALIIAYLLGVMVGLELFVEAIFISILVAVMLFSRERLHRLVTHLSENTVEDLFAFIILLGIIYPVIPQEPILLYGISFPVFIIWLFIITISLINFGAFLAAKYFTATQEIGLLSFFSGFISSTVGTATLINLFKQNKKLASAVQSGFLLITSSMLIRNFALVMVPVPATIEKLLIPLAIAVLFLTGRAYLGLKTKQRAKKLVIDTPFNTLKAVKLGLFIMALFIILNAVVQTFNTTAFLAICFLGGLVSSEGVSVTIAGLLLQNHVTLIPATIGLVLASFSSISANYLLCFFNKTTPILRTAKIVTASMILLVISLVVIEFITA